MGGNDGVILEGFLT